MHRFRINHMPGGETWDTADMASALLCELAFAPTQAQTATAESLRTIRRPMGCTQPVLEAIVGTSAMQGDREACLAAGMDDDVTKPGWTRCESGDFRSVVDAMGEARTLVFPSADLSIARVPIRAAGELSARSRR